MKYSFKNDYAEGCHPRILKALTDSNMVQQAGYGNDDYSLEAAELIKAECKHPHAAVHFVSGGTQANLLVISALLKPYESVISADTGHIFTNEAGAIEATGHKVHGVPTEDGKLTPEKISAMIAQHQNKPHQLKQRMVYISNATELGTIYSLDELKALSDYCKRNELLLFMDGARLAQALVAKPSNVTMADVAALTDVFYLGGTKNGALLGEALIINNTDLQRDFDFNVKQKGALLAKGRLLGLQFRELLTDGLYLELATTANRHAMELKHAFVEAGHTLLADTFTNQIFPVLPKPLIDELLKEFDFYVWRDLGDRAAIRLITSWATPQDAIKKLCNRIAEQS